MKLVISLNDDMTSRTALVNDFRRYLVLSPQCLHEFVPLCVEIQRFSSTVAMRLAVLVHIR